MNKEIDRDLGGSGYFDSIRGFTKNARLFLASMSLSELSMAAFAVILNIYLRRLGYSKSFLGVFTTINLLSSGFISIPAGIIADKYGRKGALLISIVVASVACIGQVVFTTSVILLLAFSALRGASNTFKGIVRSPLLVDNSGPRERMHLFSVNSALSHLSAVLGSSLGGLMPMFIIDTLGMTQNLDIAPLRISLIIAALFWLLSALPVFFMSELKLPKSASKRESVFMALQNPIARSLAVHNMFIGFGAGLVVPFFNVFLTEKLVASTEQIGFIMAGSQVVLTVAVLVTPLLVKKFGKVKSVVLTQGASVPLLLVMALSPSIWVVTVAYWLRNSLMNMSQPITGSFSMEIVPQNQRATTSSLMSMSNNLTRAVSATVGGFMMDRVSLGSPYFGTAVIYTLGIIFYYRSFTKLEKK